MSCPVSSAPSMLSGGLSVSESLLEETRRYRRFAETSQSVDRGSTCAAAARGQQRRGVLRGRARQIWFRSRLDGVEEWKTQEEDCGKEKAADEDLQFCHLQMPIVLDGRSVLEQTNERVSARWETSASA